MFVKDVHDCKAFTAGDGTLLREILHPEKAKLRLRYSLAYAVVSPGQTSRPHRLKAAEVYYILEGKGLMHVDGESAPVRPHQAVYIPPDARQYIHNTGASDLSLLCIVDPAWTPDMEEVF